MKKQKFKVLLASAAILGSSMAGCNGAGLEGLKLTAGNSQLLAPQIERALGEKDAATALALAERLVGADPQDATARALLGRAYLANGRYVSARTAFNDALTLGNRDSRTIVSLALVEAGTGNLDGARRFLADHIAELPAGDYGLAMAMAGDAREGVRALLEASRMPDATAKTRQNLAYALAMAGAWGQARLIAGQDLAANEAEQRIAEWSQLARANDGQRVVAMLGVSPRGDDAGLPAQLALNQTPAQLATVADIVEDAGRDGAAQSVSAEPVPAEAVKVAAAGAEVPVTAPALVAAPVSEPKPAFAPRALAAALAKLPVPTVAAPSAQGVTKVAFAPAMTARPAMAKTAAIAPLPKTAPVAFSKAPAVAVTTAKPSVKPAMAPVLRAPAVKAAFIAPAAAKPSDWVIQLGAFNSESVATAKLIQIAGKHGVLKSYQPVLSTLTLNAKVFHRLALRGFKDRPAAISACSALRATGQACFVRLHDAKQDAAVASAQPAGRNRPAR